MWSPGVRELRTLQLRQMTWRRGCQIHSQWSCGSSVEGEGQRHKNYLNSLRCLLLLATEATVSFYPCQVLLKYCKPRMSPLLSQGTLDMLRDLEISRSLYIDVFSFFSREDVQGQGRDGLTGAGAWIRACWVQEWQIMMIYHHIMITLWCYIMLYDIILNCTIWSTIWYYYVLVQL